MKSVPVPRQVLSKEDTNISLMDNSVRFQLARFDVWTHGTTVNSTVSRAFTINDQVIT